MVRFDADGTVDPDTWTGEVRLPTNMLIKLRHVLQCTQCMLETHRFVDLGLTFGSLFD